MSDALKAASGKQSPECLSRLQISQWVLGEATPGDAARFAAHVSTCGRCRTLRAQEDAAFSEAAGTELPTYIVAAQAEAAKTRSSAPKTTMTVQRRSWAMRAAGPVALLAASVLAVLVIRHNDAQDNVRLKGKATLHAALRRNGAIMETPIDDLGPLHSGDSVRLRVPSNQNAWVLLQKQTSNGSWEAFFTGHPDEEGWLPLSFSISESPAVNVRVAICLAQPDASTQDEAQLQDCTIYATRF